MSIIERALGKLGGGEKTPPADAPQYPVVSEPIARNIDSGISKQEPIAAAPQARAQPKHDAPPARSINIDLVRMDRLGMLTPKSERSQLGEEMRHIKRPLLANAFGPNAQRDKNRHLIMVTSSLPAEGKSFCAINLAVSLASELDRTVLLVDADVARPRVLQYLGLRAEIGLLDVLRDPKIDLGDVLLRTNIEKLSIVPAGTTNLRSTELLASDAMTALIDEMAGRYPDRIIVFDSPPLLATSEAAILARHMGQVIMVVEADKTPKAVVKEAAAMLDGACDIVGMVLNKTQISQGSAGYYGYGYGYGGETK